MKTRKSFLISSLLALLAVTPVVGAEKAMTLTLEKAIEIAMDENPTIKVSGLEIERQEYVKKQTKGNLYPSLSTEAGYMRTLIHSETGGYAMTSDNTFSVDATLAVPLFAPAVYRTLKLNDIEMQSAVESARSSKVTLASEVKIAYYNILVAEESLLVLNESEKTMQETVDQTQVMFDNGLASEYDLLTAQVQLNNLKPTIIQTKNSINTAKLLFKMYLSLPSEVDITLNGKLEDFVTSTMSFSRDLANNTDIRNLELQDQMLAQQLKILKTQRMPTLAAYGSLAFSSASTSEFSAMFSSMSQTTPDKYTTQWPLYAGVTLSIPIFNGFTKINQEKQAKNSISQLKLQKSYLEQSVKVQLESAVNSIITASEQMQANKLTVEQAAKAYKISNVRYTTGTGTILELNSAELSKTQAQLNYSQAVYDYLSAEADYQKILGNQ
ncbi:MAG: TolC family protein [Rikenellaceae bacterium]